MKKNIRITHLYPELMNTYGDLGNVIALTRRLEWRNFSVELKKYSIGSTLKPGETDIYFFGGGQDIAQNLVASDLIRLRGVIREDIENNIPLLAICGGFQLLGQYFLDSEGNKLIGLGIFNAFTEASPKRMIGNVLAEGINVVPGNKLLGFENHSGKTYLVNGTKPLAKIIIGHGNNGEDGYEGAVYRNAIGTYLHGSFLPKNPRIADFLITKSVEKKYPGYKIESLDDSLEKQAFISVEKNTLNR